jgi:AcrR family transcriptional regulator
MADGAASAPGDEPSWKQRAVERSTRGAKLRAEQRVQRFLDAAQAIITDTGSTDFTVQDVVNRSSQSLRSFYQHFDGKHELLLALFEDALRRATAQIAAATDAQAAPIDALRAAVQLLFELSRPDPGAHRPLFTEFAPRLLLSHPAEVRRAHAPLLELLATLTARAADAGQLRPVPSPAVSPRSPSRRSCSPPRPAAGPTPTASSARSRRTKSGTSSPTASPGPDSGQAAPAPASARTGRVRYLGRQPGDRRANSKSSSRTDPGSTWVGFRNNSPRLETRP